MRARNQDPRLPPREGPLQRLRVRRTEGRAQQESKLDLKGSGVDSSDAFSGMVRLIGTCNGLLCLRRKRGDIAVTNPAVIGETIAVEPPLTWHARCESTHSFGYHPATGQYKIVHVPCNEHQGSESELYAVNVFALGDGSWRWREVPAPAGSSCLLSFGLVSIDGVTYWVTMDGNGIMSFHLKDERVAHVELPPVPVAQPMEFRQPCHLTDVRGRLGLVACDLPEEFTS